jgi:hypothetical protein
LQNNLLQLTIRLEDLLEIRFRNAEMNVAHVEAVEWGAVSTWGHTTLGGTRSAILLCFRELSDDRNALQLLARQLKSLGDRFLVLELNIADSRFRLA